MRHRPALTAGDTPAGPNRPPLPESSPAWLFARASSLALGLGLPPLASAAVGGASDGNFTAGAGVPTPTGLARSAAERMLMMSTCWPAPCPAGPRCSPRCSTTC
jgi:hypothetical protein